jgi:hypothetical protein
VSEPQYLDLTEQRIRRLAELLADATRVAKDADANALRGAVVMFADCLPSSVALAIADEVRAWSGDLDRDDAHAVALRSLLRLLDPSGSPKV